MDLGSVLNSISDNARAAMPENEGDYIGDDGLLYCHLCNTPKQCRINVPMFGDAERTVFCLCKCEEAKRDAEREMFKQNMMKDEIERNRRSGIKDIMLLNNTFEKDEHPESDVSIKLRRYCEKHEEAYKNNCGLLMYGEKGTGKSFYAGCIANNLIDKGIKVMCTSIPMILNGIFSEDNKSQYVNSIVSYPFLIIDDFGTERGTDYALEQVFLVINERYKSNMPTIITTNLTPKEIASETDLKYQRIYDRIIEMCSPFKFEGNSKRIGISIKKSKMLKEMLEG